MAPKVSPNTHPGREGLRALPLHLFALAATGIWVGLYPVGLYLSGGLTIPDHMRLSLLASVGYLGAVALVLRPPLRHARRELAIILALAVIYRLVMLLTNPSLSDDLLRYVWDAKLLSNGISPYEYAPDAPELAYLRDTTWQAITHRTTTSPYPPLTQYVALLAYWLAPGSTKAMQVAATVGDLFVIGALLMLLSATGHDRRRVAIYAWSPLVLTSFAHSGHNDSWMIAFMIFALALAIRGRSALSALALGLGVLAKFVPALLVPMMLRRWRLRAVAVFAAVVAVGYIPFVGVGAGAIGVALRLTVGSGVVFNDSLHLVATRVLGFLLDDPSAAARMLSLAAVAMVAVIVALRRPADPVWGAYWVLGTFIAVSSYVQPWYVVWILPLLAIQLAGPKGGRPRLALAALGWLLLSVTVELTDLTYGQNPTLTWPVVRLLEYGPLYALLSLSLLLGIRRLWLDRRRDGPGAAEVARPRTP